MPARAVDRLGLLAAAALGGLILYANRDFFHDDGYIGLRYVRHWLEGHGPRWNPGEAPVEGYSNFLYLALVALLGRFGLDLVWAARLVGLASWAATALLLARQGPWPAAGVLTSLPLAVWALGGLETPFFALLATGGVLLGARAWDDPRPPPWATAGAVLALACCARPDGGLFAAAAFAFALYGFWRGRLGAAAVVALALGLGAILVPYLGWKLHYYGQILPNTFYAKSGTWDAERAAYGLRYVGSYLIRPPFLYMLAGGALFYAVRQRRLDAPLAFVGCSALAYLSYAALAGGDHMPAYRFVAPVIPLAYVFIHGALRPWLDAQAPSARAVTWAVFIMGAALQLISFGGARRPLDPAAFTGRLIARYQQVHWPPQTLVALNTAGSVPYFAADYRYIDMLGLNDAHIARRHPVPQRGPWQRVAGHGKGDGAYVLDRRPDFIVLGPAEGVRADAPYFLSDFEIAADPRFARSYREETAFIDVSRVAGHRNYLATRSGTLTFTYYRRGAP